MTESAAPRQNEKSPNQLYRSLVLANLGAAALAAGLVLLAVGSVWWLDRQDGQVGLWNYIALGLWALSAGTLVALIRRLGRRQAAEIVQPIVAMTNAAEEIAAGRPPQGLALEGPGELGQLAQAFKKMAASLAQAQAYSQYQLESAKRDKGEAEGKFEAEFARRHQVETALVAGQAKEKALIAALPDLVFRLDNKGTLLECHGSEQADIDPEYLVGRKMGDMLTDTLAEVAQLHLERVMAGQGIQVFACQIPTEGRMGNYEARLLQWGAAEALMMVREIPAGQAAAPSGL